MCEFLTDDKQYLDIEEELNILIGELARKISYDAPEDLILYCAEYFNALLKDRDRESTSNIILKSKIPASRSSPVFQKNSNLLPLHEACSWSDPFSGQQKYHTQGRKGFSVEDVKSSIGDHPHSAEEQLDLTNVNEVGGDVLEFFKENRRSMVRDVFHADDKNLLLCKETFSDSSNNDNRNLFEYCDEADILTTDELIHSDSQIECPKSSRKKWNKNADCKQLLNIKFKFPGTESTGSEKNYHDGENIHIDKNKSKKLFKGLSSYSDEESELRSFDGSTNAKSETVKLQAQKMLLSYACLELEKKLEITEKGIRTVFESLFNVEDCVTDTLLELNVLKNVIQNEQENSYISKQKRSTTQLEKQHKRIELVDSATLNETKHEKNFHGEEINFKLSSDFDDTKTIINQRECKQLPEIDEVDCVNIMKVGIQEADRENFPDSIDDFDIDQSISFVSKSKSLLNIEKYSKDKKVNANSNSTTQYHNKTRKIIQLKNDCIQPSIIINKLKAYSASSSGDIVNNKKSTSLYYNKDSSLTDIVDDSTAVKRLETICSENINDNRYDKSEIETSAHSKSTTLINICGNDQNQNTATFCDISTPVDNIILSETNAYTTSPSTSRCEFKDDSICSTFEMTKVRLDDENIIGDEILIWDHESPTRNESGYFESDNSNFNSSPASATQTDDGVDIKKGTVHCPILIEENRGTAGTSNSNTLVKYDLKKVDKNITTLGIQKESETSKLFDGILPDSMDIDVTVNNQTRDFVADRNQQAILGVTKPSSEPGVQSAGGDVAPNDMQVTQEQAVDTTNQSSSENNEDLPMSAVSEERFRSTQEEVHSVESNFTWFSDSDSFDTLSYEEEDLTDEDDMNNGNEELVAENWNA